MHPRLMLYSLPLVAGALFVAAPTLVHGADLHPKACISCHVVDKATGKDHRLSHELAEWTAGDIDAELLAHTKATMPAGVASKGKHPKAEDALEDIPAACMDCHAGGSKKAPPFSRLIHLVHLTGDKNPFLTSMKGSCASCHKLNPKTGEQTIPSGPEQ